MRKRIREIVIETGLNLDPLFVFMYIFTRWWAIREQEVFPLFPRFCFPREIVAVLSLLVYGLQHLQPDL